MWVHLLSNLNDYVKVWFCLHHEQTKRAKLTSAKLIPNERIPEIMIILWIRHFGCKQAKPHFQTIWNWMCHQGPPNRLVGSYMELKQGKTDTQEQDKRSLTHKTLTLLYTNSQTQRLTAQKFAAFFSWSCSGHFKFFAFQLAKLAW